MDRILIIVAGLCFAAAAALIIISAEINYKYGVQINPLIGWAFLMFGFVEIFLPVLAMFASGFPKTLGKTIAIVLAILSIVTAASFLSANRYKAEDKVKGYTEALSSSNEVASIARQSYSQASKSAARAQQMCDAEKAKGPRGYITKFCNQAKEAQAAKNAAFSQMQAASQGVSRSRDSVIAPGDKIFYDIASWTGIGDAGAWKNGINTFTAILLAFTGCACIIVILNVAENHFGGLFGASLRENDIVNSDQPSKKIQIDNKRPAIEGQSALKSELKITGEGSCRIPLRYSGNSYIAEINVNGKQGEFIVDTGATSICMDMETYNGIGRPTGEPADLATSSGSVRTICCKVRGQLGVFDFDQADAVVCDHNLLGMQILKPLNAQIDYGKNELVLRRDVKDSNADESPKQQAKKPAKGRPRKRPPVDNNSIAKKLADKGIISLTVRGLTSAKAKSNGLNVGTKTASQIIKKINEKGKTGE